MKRVDIAGIERVLGYRFYDRTLIETALTHPSAVEGMPRKLSYERLEFLGDSILGALVARDLYQRYPDMDEGDLTRLKIHLVSGETLSQAADELGITEYIRFGASEHGTGSRGLRSARENVYEALVGALYLDGGVEVCHDFVLRTLRPHLQRGLDSAPVNPKSRLQEVTQADRRGMPEYDIVDQSGPAHEPVFTCVVKVGGVRVGKGSGHSKKDAEAAAALDALNRLGAVE
jgi:ribonuclease-3